MRNMLIRRAIASDIERLVELRLLLQQHCEESNPLIWRITKEGKRLTKQKVEDTLTDSNSRLFVAEMNGQIIGFAHGQVVHRIDYSPETVGAINTVYVVEKFRRKGVGARLVEEMCEFFKSEGVDHVTLRYILGNKEAERFWMKLGFEQMITTARADLKELESRVSQC
jgi:GNAT superfamily N-acetyltransferase